MERIFDLRNGSKVERVERDADGCCTVLLNAPAICIGSDNHSKRSKSPSYRFYIVTGSLILTAMLALAYSGIFERGAHLETIRQANIQAGVVIEEEHAPELLDRAPMESIPAVTAPDAFSLTEAERRAVESVVMAEARGESYEGQMAVAQCIRNTAEARGMRPDEVVFEKNQYATPFDGDASQSVKDAVSAVFDRGEKAIDANVRYFYAPGGMENGTSEWHETSLLYAGSIGAHRFFEAVNE